MRAPIIVLLLSISGLTFSQDLVSLSKVKLKDGSQFTAQIIENQPGSFIKIRVTGDQTTIIQYSEIESIKAKNFTYFTEFYLPRKFFLEGAYSFVFGKSGTYDDLRAGISLGLTGNYRFYPSLSVGLGIGVDALYLNSSFLLVPLYGRISGSLEQKRISPYYIFDFGWSAASTGDNRETDVTMNGGYMIRPEAGVRINSLRIGVAYQIQKITTSQINNLWWGWGNDQQLIEETRIMRNIKFGVSIIF